MRRGYAEVPSSANDSAGPGPTVHTYRGLGLDWTGPECTYLPLPLLANGQVRLGLQYIQQQPPIQLL